MTTPLVCAQSIHRLFLAFGLAALAIPALATEPASHAGMKEVTLDGLHVWLGQPVEVTKQIGWGQEWVHSQAEPSYSFIHLTPYMDRFPNGNLIVTYAMDPDTQVNPICLSAFQISSDAGRHWGRRYTTVMQHNPLIFIPKPDSDSLLGLPCELMSLSAAQPNVYAGPAYLFEHGGARMVLIPDGVKIVDWPWPVETNPGVQPPDSWHVGITLTGSAVSAEKRILATGHSFQRDAKGAKMFHNEIFASDVGQGEFDRAGATQGGAGRKNPWIGKRLSPAAISLVKRLRLLEEYGRVSRRRDRGCNRQQSAENQGAHGGIIIHMG